MNPTAPTPRFSTIPPLSLYIHLPWCTRKCPYCDFNSHAADTFDENAYVDALIEDLHHDLHLVWGRSLHSIFIGGGTPSLFSAQAIDRLLCSLRAAIKILPNAEITLEANPGSAEAARFAGYRKAGINRLSIGVQSFDNGHLSALGRIHDRQQALAAFEAARAAGFDNINLDLMYGLPGQTTEAALADLRKAIELGPEHISHYQLTLEPNTLFHSKPPAALPDDDTAWAMQQQGQDLLATADFAQYEISAYSRPRRRSRHNLNYWQFGDYLGIGAGAHGKITLPADNRVLRRVRVRQPGQYIAADPAARISSDLRLSSEDLAFEFMLNALRLVDGFALKWFEHHCGLPQSALLPNIEKAVDKGLLELDSEQVRPTGLGLRFHNDLQAIFLEPDWSAVNRSEPVIAFN